MNTKIFPLVILLCTVWCANAQDPKPTPVPPQASGGGAAMTDPTFRLVRSVAGTKLFQDSGRLVIEDPRTVFYAPADKEIIVYFTWEGPPGQHHFEGMWKNPSARVMMTSEFDYKSAERRFGGYFKMLPGDAPAAGLWSLEARIDGESAGSHQFEIVVAPRPDNIGNANVRRALGPSEIYNRAAAASVLIENINAKGARRNVGTGSFIGPGRLLTTWLPKEKHKGYPSLRFYDLDNKMIGEMLNKKKITVDPNKLSYSLWELNLAQLSPGIYRIDVLLDGDFVYRTFFRMVE